MRRRARGVIFSAFALLSATATTIAALWSVRPDLTISSVTARGDDLAYAVAWILAISGASWLLLTTLACLAALVRGGPNLAARIARWGPPIGRRILQTALAGTFVVVPATANATPATPPAPLVLHVGPGGHLTGVPAPSPGTDPPVVRTPPSTTLPPRPSTTTTSVPRAALLPLPALLPVVRAPSASRAAPSHEPRAERRVPVARRHLVRTGDNLWQVARSEVVRVTGVELPDDRTVAGYWLQVTEANRTTLRSGNPSLIYPGELVVLPVVAAA